MERGETIWEFKTARFAVRVSAITEDSPDLSWDDDGSVREGLERGKYVLFCARAVLTLDGYEIVADYLGNCIYESLEDFRQEVKGYFGDMVHEVISTGRKEIARLQTIQLRH